MTPAMVIYNRFSDAGYTPEQIAGVLGNSYVESAGLQPGINEIKPLVPGSRGGFGLMQWTGPRRRQFESFVEERGGSLDDASIQADFALWELDNTEKKAGAALRAAKTPEQAAAVVSNRYLRPGIPHLTRRVTAARSFYDGMDGLQVSDSGQVATDAQFTREEILAELQRRQASEQPQFGRDEIMAELARRGEAEQPSGGVPEGMFLNPVTGQYTSRELLKNVQDVSTTDAALAGGTQGMSFGTIDEMMGVVGRLEGGEDMANFRREQARARIEAAEDQRPVTTMAADVAGSMLVPAGAATSAGRAAAVGALAGGARAAGDGEGGLQNRAVDGAQGAATGALLGAGAAKITQVGTNQFRRLFEKTAERPTVAGLRMTKQMAYKAVDDAGEVFEPDEIIDFVASIENQLDASGYVGGFGQKMDAQLGRLQKLALRDDEVSLSALDDIRSRLWKTYETAKDEVELLDVISSIDDLIDSKAGASELMAAARLANSRYRKSQMLEDAFNKAELQTASTGSGGNILNKYRQAVTAIYTNPRKAKWFNEQELALMESFVRGNRSEEILRRVGKLAPGGNGLMSALNLYAAAIDPTMLAATATASAAKGAADRSVTKGSEGLLDFVATGQKRAAQKPVNVGRPASAAGQFGGSF